MISERLGLFDAVFEIFDGIGYKRTAGNISPWMLVRLPGVYRRNDIKYKHFGTLSCTLHSAVPQPGRLLQLLCIASIGVAPQASEVPCIRSFCSIVVCKKCHQRRLMMVFDLAHTAFHEWLSNDSNSHQHGTNTTKPQHHHNIARTLALGVFPPLKWTYNFQ